MQKLKKFIGSVLIQLLTDNGGTSITKCNEMKNQNANEITKLEKELSPAIYNKATSFLTSAGEVEKSVLVDKITPSHFDKVEVIGDLKGRSSLLGFGIQLFKKIEEKVSFADHEDISKSFDIEIPRYSYQGKEPRKIAVVAGGIDNFMDKDRIEDMAMLVINDRVWAMLDENFLVEALRLESRAAAYGQVLTSNKTFLKKVMSAPRKIEQPEQVVSGVGILFTEDQLAYTEEEVKAFEGMYESLYAEYSSLQGQVSGKKKQLKDAVRDVNNLESKEYAVRFGEYANKCSQARELHQKWVNEIEDIRSEMVTELKGLKVRV